MTRAAAILLLALALATALWYAKRGPAPAELTIHFTCDVHGRLVPCGCFSGQMGGLTRIASLIGNLPSDEVLRVDVGNAIGGSADYQVLQHRYILRAFADMGFEAVNLGHAEAQLSAPQL